MRTDRYWRAIYGRYELFKTQFDACVNRLLELSSPPPVDSAKPYSGSTGVLREPSKEMKQQVKMRDHNTCLCCGDTNERALQIDHINPFYLGGASDDLANLQTLCRICNQFKGTNVWNYRIQQSSHSSLQRLAMPAMPTDPGAMDEWERFVRRAINGAYGCAAVAEVRIGKRGPRRLGWEVSLFKGNDAAAFEVLLPTLLGQIQSVRHRARLEGPESLTVLAFGST